MVQQTEAGTYWWCACGRSKGQPFCDGSHKGTGLRPIKAEIPEAKGRLVRVQAFATRALL
jgi:CDGSH-type Zn-finger protein